MLHLWKFSSKNHGATSSWTAKPHSFIEIHSTSGFNNNNPSNSGIKCWKNAKEKDKIQGNHKFGLLIYFNIFIPNCFLSINLEIIIMSLALFQFSGTMHLKSLSEPGFVRETLNNVTVPEGRDALLSCTVENLDNHKVRMNFHRQIIIHFIDLV